MKKIITGIIFILITYSVSFAGWQEGSIIGVPTINCKENIAVFVNTYYPQYQYSGSGTWNLIDISAYVPEDTKAVFLSGILIITNAGYGCADLHVHFRAPGDTTTNSANYHGQAIEASYGDGIRSTYSTWVPVVDGHIEMFWSGVQIQGVTYGINLTAQAYVR